MTSSPPGRPSSAEPLVLVLGTADWDAVIATNQHRVTPSLAQRHPVLFVEGTGTRRLRLSDAGRIVRRLGPAPAGHLRRVVPEGVTVVTPRIVPHHAPPTAVVNRLLLTRRLRRWTQHPGPRVLWTYTPFTYGLERLADASVYHLVDLLHENPGVDAGRLLAAERTLAASAGLAVATSPAVEQHLRAQGFAVTRCLRNVADVELFAAAAQRRTAAREPVVVVAGTVAGHKLDLPLLARLAGRLNGRAVLRLVGPLAPGVTADPAWSALLAAGAEVRPAVGAAELAEQLAGATVGLVPYRVNALTRGISPLKSFEYLAAGLAVVSTPLPAVQPVPGALWVEPDADAFVARVLELLDADPARVARCRAAATGHDWTARGQELRGLLEGLLRGAPSGSDEAPALV